MVNHNFYYLFFQLYQSTPTQGLSYSIFILILTQLNCNALLNMDGYVGAYHHIPFHGD